MSAHVGARAHIADSGASPPISGDWYRNFDAAARPPVHGNFTARFSTRTARVATSMPPSLCPMQPRAHTAFSSDGPNAHSTRKQPSSWCPRLVAIMPHQNNRPRQRVLALAVTYQQERHRRLLGPCAAHEGAATRQGQTALTPTTLRSGGTRCRFSLRCPTRPTQAPELACGRRTASGKSSGAGSSSCGASPGHVLQ